MKKTVKKNVIKKNVNNEVVNEFKNVVMNQIELLKLSESEDDQLTAVLYMLLHLYMIDDIISFRLANNIKDLHIENYDKDFSTLCDKLAKYMYNLSSIQEMNEDKLEFNRWLNSSLGGNGKTMRELTMNVVESTSDLIIIALFNLEISKKMQLYK